MKYFFVAGEHSGDLHGSALITQLFSLEPEAEISAWGGVMMRHSGAKLLKSYHDYTSFGFWQVLVNIRHLKQQLDLCKQDINRLRPDVLVLIDFPGFNLRLAKYAKSIGVKVCYYIAPKLWAWNSSRVSIIRQYVDQLLVIFPFEVAYYQQFGIHATYVGNPSVEYLGAFMEKNKPKDSTVSIAVLPGSRGSEIKELLPVLKSVAEGLPELTFKVSRLNTLSIEKFREIERLSNVEICEEESRFLMNTSSLAIVASGTATLEAALLNVPQIVIYKTNKITYWLARLLVKIPHISLVNILLKSALLLELIQSDCSPGRLIMEIEKLIGDVEQQKKISEGYSEIRKILGTKSASASAAKIVQSLGCS